PRPSATRRPRYTPTIRCRAERPLRGSRRNHATRTHRAQGAFARGRPACYPAGVNILAPPRARVQIEVVFDLVCPWCHLGTHRLRRTLRTRPELAADIIWRPFLLNPDIGPGGVPRQDYVLRKF